MRGVVFAGAAVGLLCLVGTVAIAQTAPQAAPQTALQTETNPPALPDSAPPAVVPAPESVVPKGTSIVVEITDLVSTKTAKRDDWFNLRLAEPVTLKDAIVIPEGTPGKGQVVDAGKPGMGGKPGKLVLAARYLEFEGRQIPIHALRLGLKADDNSGASVAVGIAFGIVGLAVTGGDMEVQPGTKARAKLAVDFVPDATGATPAAPAATVDPAPKPQDAAASSSSAAQSHQ